VVGIWVAFAFLLPPLFPSLAGVIQNQPVTPLPADAPAIVASCTSRPIPVTGSASLGSRRSDAFKIAHQLSDVTVVADAGMISETNQTAVQAAGLSFILGTRIPRLPDVVREWCDAHPDQDLPDGHVLTQPWPATSSEKARGIPDRVIYHQYRHDPARRTLRGIDEQVRKAERAVDGHAPVKRNRYIQLAGATNSVNRTLEAKTRALAGWKGNTTHLTTQSPVFVIDADHQLWHIEKAFRMSKHDLQARPIYHHLRESIEAHLSIVVAAMAVSHYIETQPKLVGASRNSSVPCAATAP